MLVVSKSEVPPSCGHGVSSPQKAMLLHQGEIRTNIIKEMTLDWGHDGLDAVPWAPTFALLFPKNVLSLRYLHKYHSFISHKSLIKSLVRWCYPPFYSFDFCSFFYLFHLPHYICIYLHYHLLPPTGCTLFENRDFNFSILYLQQLDQGWHIIGAQCIFIEWMNNECINEWMNKWEQKEWTRVDQKGEITSLLVNKLWNNILFIWLQTIFSIKLITACNRAQSSTQPLK